MYELFTTEEVAEFGIRVVSHDEALCTVVHADLDDDDLFEHMLTQHGVYLDHLDPDLEPRNLTWNGAYH